MYATYKFYVDNIGGTIPEDDFPKVESHAEAILRYLTFHNGDIFEERNDEIKKAVCVAADVIYQQLYQGTGAASSAGSVKSVNNDGYSVSFAPEKTDGQTAEVFLQKKVYDAVSIYLSQTKWLCRWVR